MSNSSTAILWLAAGVLSALMVLQRSADAQPAVADPTWVALDVTAAINREIERSSDSLDLRRRLVRRFSECSLMYGGLSTLASSPEAKRNYVQAQEATMEVESAIASPLQQQMRLELEGVARNSVALMLRGVKAHGDKEVGPLLKNCKALNDLKEIKNALRELPRE